MLAGMLNIPYAVLYQNINAVGDFMPSEQLKTAFYLALQAFPILAGHLKQTGDGHFSMVVDRDKLNKPEYLESTSDVHYKDIKSAWFDQRTWPSGVVTTGSIMAPDTNGIIKTTNVHIVRLKDNSGLILYLSIIHCVVDGFGYFAFLNHWAAVCKTMRSGVIGMPKPMVEFTFDRTVVEQSLTAERKQLDPINSSIFAQPSLLSKWLEWISPQTRARILNLAATLTTFETHVFHIADSTMESLCSSVREFVPEGMRVSDNDVLVALLGKTYAQAQRSAKEKGGDDFTRVLGSMGSAVFGGVYRTDEHQVTSIACDIRPRIGIANKNYIGCPLAAPLISNPLDDLLMPTTAKSLASIVSSVRRCIDSLDAPYVRAFIETVGSAPSSFAKPTAYLLKHPPLLLTSNQTRLRMFEADFGDGYQEWATFIREKPGLAVLMSCPPPIKGFSISMCAETAVFREMLANEFWMSVVTQIN